MARIDVTDALLDPDYIDFGLVCVRGEQIVGEDGLARNVESEIEFAGTVHRKSELVRLPNGEHIVASITVHTAFQLRDGDQGLTADIIAWKGKRYTVVEVHDRSNFGRGFCKAKCALIPLSG